MNINKDSLIQNYKNRHAEELLEMHASGTLTDLAYEILEDELKARDVQIPDRPATPDYSLPLETRGQFFANYWKGNKSLTSAFWGLYICGRIFIFITVLLIVFLLNKYLHLYLQGNFYKIIYNIAFYGAFIVFFVPHTIFAWVSVLRCAKNVFKPIWGTIAIIIIFFDFLSAVSWVSESL